MTKAQAHHSSSSNQLGEKQNQTTPLPNHQTPFLSFSLPSFLSLNFYSHFKFASSSPNFYIFHTLQKGINPNFAAPTVNNLVLHPMDVPPQKKMSFPGMQKGNFPFRNARKHMWHDSTVPTPPDQMLMSTPSKKYSEAESCDPQTIINPWGKIRRVRWVVGKAVKLKSQPFGCVHDAGVLSNLDSSERSAEFSQAFNEEILKNEVNSNNVLKIEEQNTISQTVLSEKMIFILSPGYDLSILDTKARLWVWKAYETRTMSKYSNFQQTDKPSTITTNKGVESTLLSHKILKWEYKAGDNPFKTKYLICRGFGKRSSWKALDHFLASTTFIRNKGGLKWGRILGPKKASLYILEFILMYYNSCYVPMTSCFIVYVGIPYYKSYRTFVTLKNTYQLILSQILKYVQTFTRTNKLSPTNLLGTYYKLFIMYLWYKFHKTNYFTIFSFGYSGVSLQMTITFTALGNLSKCVPGEADGYPPQGLSKKKLQQLISDARKTGKGTEGAVAPIGVELECRNLYVIHQISSQCPQPSTSAWFLHCSPRLMLGRLSQTLCTYKEQENQANLSLSILQSLQKYVQLFYHSLRSSPLRFILIVLLLKKEINRIKYNKSKIMKLGDSSRKKCKWWIFEEQSMKQLWIWSYLIPNTNKMSIILRCFNFRPFKITSNSQGGFSLMIYIYLLRKNGQISILNPKVKSFIQDTMQKIISQLPAVDMQHAPAYLPSKLHMFADVDFLAQSLCSIHSDCASMLC
ncbi:hypothetical protein VP01_1209g1 [Puccinia sorghi]|uniref:Uncharacterized protein n=1 Tax=Puccinia sorghi TaxID=27349 RepID=A0A0L6VQD3_9BASI|nr:hypothetical protein VP01_1209g1 [Puccinia sorghi]